MYDTIIISDVHISREDSNVKELVEFIINNPSKKLVLNGDIFDQFAWWRDKGRLYRKEHKKHVKEIKQILKERKTKIYYLPGNHDWLVLLLIPIGFLFRAKIRKRIKLKGILIEHGDWFTFYLKVRKIFDISIEISKDYHSRCLTFAKLKKKKIVVGHSHNPEIIEDIVYDVGDWVKNNTYLILENWV